MIKIGIQTLVIMLIASMAFAQSNNTNQMDMKNKSFYDFSATSIDGEEISMEKYKDKVVLIVNTASECGFTPQYEGLEKLNKEYADKGLVVLGFPCNQFGKQEPGEEKEIASFCQVNYGVTFQMFSKIDVNGDSAHPLYQFLKNEKGGLLGSRIKWNFTKFLIDRDGKVVDRFASTTKPAALVKDIEKLL
jgi:glutathione peroxidase